VHCQRLLTEAFAEQSHDAEKARVARRQHRNSSPCRTLERDALEQWPKRANELDRLLVWTDINIGEVAH
jgi:hypothetical protein